MADSKISALPASTTPLAGTEVVPIVQGGTTKNVSVANLTAGRAVATASVSTTAGVQIRGADATNYELLRWAGGPTNNPGIFGRVDETTNTANVWLSGSYTGGQVLGLGAAGVMDTLELGSENAKIKYGNLVIGTSGKGIDFSADSSAAGMTSELLDDYEEGSWTPVISAAAGSITSYTSSGYYTKVGRQVIVNGVFTITNNGTGAAGIVIAGIPYSILNSIAGGSARENAVNGQMSSISAGNTTQFVMYTCSNEYPGATNASFQFSATYFN